MKASLLMLCIFAVLTLCLPLAALGAALPTAVAPAAAQNDTPQEQTQQAPQGTQPPQQKEPEQKAQEPTAGGAPIETASSFRILNTATGKVQTVKRTDYVRGAVCAEMPPDFHTQALTAQAVAVNTYAVRCQLEQQANPDPQLKGADFSANPNNWEGYVTKEQAQERFGKNFALYWDKIAAAADVGSNYVMVYEGEPIVAAYHSLSSGKTEYAGNVWVGEAPYLSPVESFGDTLALNYESTAVFSAQEVAEKLKAENPQVALAKEKAGWLRVLSRSDSGYVLEVESGGVTFTGKDIRRIFELRSSCFTVAVSGSTFTFTVRGYGHGVGLSQYGADYMARQGSSFDQILMHYYTGCEMRMVRVAPAGKPPKP